MICQECKQQSPATAKFCIHCGVRLVRPAPAPPQKMYDSSPQTYETHDPGPPPLKTYDPEASPLPATPPQQPTDDGKLTKKPVIPVPTEGTQLRVKGGREAGAVFPITTPSVEFKLQTGDAPSPKPQFAIEKTSSGYAVRPLPQADSIYVNGNLTRYTQHLSHGDEISIPPYITYTVEIGPEQIPVGKRTGWIVVITLQQLLAGAVTLIMGLTIINNAGPQDIGAFLFITGTALLVGTVGLWQMREWGRWTTVTVRVIDILINLAMPPINFVAMGINLAVVLYLARASLGGRFR